MSSSKFYPSSTDTRSTTSTPSGTQDLGNSERGDIKGEMALVSLDEELDPVEDIITSKNNECDSDGMTTLGMGVTKQL